MYIYADSTRPSSQRQRRFFFYMTGVPLADSQVVYDIETSKLTLFIPPIDPEHVMWAGLPPSPEEILAKYDVDEVKYTTELNAALAHVSTGKKTTVFAIPEQVSDHVSFLEFEDKNFSILKKAIEDTRVVKDDYEIALIAKANEISSAAHKLVLEKVNKVENESELEAAFLGYCVSKGAKEQAYHSIVASGRSAATLHYIPNDAPMGGKLNLLLDAGAEWRCYASDITRTFPINGKFSPESRAIYDLVLKMQLECIAMLKEGVLWDDVHLLAHKIAIDGLLALGVLKGDKEAILKQRTSNAFFPHGLGHYLGMDTHDTGGNPNYSDPDPMFRYLRVRGALPAGSVITVEPGVYFSEFLIAPYLKDPEHSRYIDQDVLEKYWDVGGVR